MRAQTVIILLFCVFVTLKASDNIANAAAATESAAYAENNDKDKRSSAAAYSESAAVAKGNKAYAAAAS